MIYLVIQKLAAKTGILVLVFLSIDSYAQKPTLLFQSDPSKTDFGQVKVVLPDNYFEMLSDICADQNCFKRLLKVYVGTEVQDDLPAIAGYYHLTSNALVFQPRFVPPPGISYTIVFRGEVLDEMLEDPGMTGSMNQTKTVKVPEIVSNAETSVVAIYPNAPLLPANLLRFYIQLSNPMSYENPYRFLKLYDSAGGEVIEPFVEVSQGLWDESRSRLTVLVHPGRIKRGVGPNMTVGAVFDESKTYKLVVNKDWKDENGQPLLDYYEHNFQITEPDRTPLNVDLWKIHKPEARTRAPLVIDFGETLDHALLNRMISLQTSNGHEIPGNITVDRYHSSWIFSPLNTWKIGNYSILIDVKLEDVAGNNLISAFDRNVGDRISMQNDDFETIPFIID